MQFKDRKVTLRAPINIALIKYWGKLHEGYNIPLNSSFSLTLDRTSISSETSVCFSDEKSDLFGLRDKSGNLIETEFPKNFDKLKSYFLEYAKEKLGVDEFYVRVESMNSFPTKAGLASSASGLSCIALCFCRLFNYFDESEDELKEDVFENIKKWFLDDDLEKVQKVLVIVLLLRIISGSSCRSVYLFSVLQIGPDLLCNIESSVTDTDKLKSTLQNQAITINNEILSLSRWRFDKSLTLAGQELEKYYKLPITSKNNPNLLYQRFNYLFSEPATWDPINTNCIAFPITSLQNSTRTNLLSFFAQIKMYVCLLHKEKKKIGSTEGMILSALTSQNILKRVDIVRSNLLALLKSIQSNDVGGFLKVVMQDSNNFHSVCLDTYPPLFYLSDKSRDAVGFMHEFNEVSGGVVVGYTFDAGPNPFILVDGRYEEGFVEGFKKRFGVEDEDLIKVDMLV